jgi:hypothetical protein
MATNKTELKCIQNNYNETNKKFRSLIYKRQWPVRKGHEWEAHKKDGYSFYTFFRTFKPHLSQLFLKSADVPFV